ncbi:LMBR1-like membrane protein-domain-containing protein [Phaeosphaeria sp. MPI-PUGE-AT-0046c]|nr:LMBR1-like membrane protein-domain-containing protein [Phaeosphaeria sp. MPI-PUGE-AT-0046c]
MSSNPTGSSAFFILSLLTICFLVVLLMRYYLPLRTTPAYVSVPVFLAIALPASIIVLLPIDLASSAGTDEQGARGIWLPDTVVYKSWRIIYWLTFALTWTILPMLGEYCDSGYREPKARAMYAVRSLGRYWAMMLGAGLVGSIYLIWWNGLHLETFKSLVMALAYTWGLILGIYLMGHGLVAFPRSLFRYANVSERLRRIQGQAPKTHERWTDALEKLEGYESQVVQLKQRKNGITREWQEWIDEMAEKGSLAESRAGVGRTTANTSIPAVITDRYLGDLARKLKRARHAKLRFENEWDHVVAKAVRTQAILDSKASQRLEFKPSPYQPSRGFLDRITILTPYTRYHLHTHIIPALTYATWGITILASTAIVWSECVREAQDFGGPKLSVIGWTVVHRQASARSRIGFGSQVTAAFWLCYMCICAFYSLTEVKIWGNRALVRRNTYQESATWYGLQVAKLTVPLSYNFLTMTDPSIWKETMFHKFLGKLIDLSPLGKGFSSFFPIFILVPVFATAFGLYGKIKNVCGFGDLLEDDDEDGAGGFAGAGSWREGRALIERELQGNNSGNTLGLAQRSNISPPNGRYSDSSASNSNSSAAPLINANSNNTAAPSSSRPRPERRRPVIEDDDEGNFFDTFATRWKNTFDTADFSFKKPQWLGGDDEGEAGPSRRAVDRGEDRGNGFLGLFGGRAEEGRVRL